VSRRVRLSKQAKEDLDNIWEWVAENSTVDAATRFVDSITDLFYTLWKHPGVGRRRDEIGPDARSFPTGNYIVYYRRRKGGIEISRVIHGPRHQTRAFKEEA
jgi:toxin ParE1/3/4